MGRRISVLLFLVMQKDKKNILITINSPGELWGWARGLIENIKITFSDVKIYILILPCVYASGMEKEMAGKLTDIEKVYSGLGSLIFDIKSLKRENGIIIHLGGDLFYSAMLSKFLKWDTWAYVWANPRLDKYIKGYFLRDNHDYKRLISQGIRPSKILICGDLLVDSVLNAQKKETNIQKDNLFPLITFMPGSRPVEISLLAPFFLKVAKIVKISYPNAFFKLLLSPFIGKEVFEKQISKEVDPEMGGIKGLFDKDKGYYCDDVFIEIEENNIYSCIQNSDLVVSIPGTKTGEAGILGRPQLVILPLNSPENIPFIGIVGLLKYFGPVGRFLKSRLILKISDKIGYLAQANILAQKEIVKELKGKLTPEGVAENIVTLLKDEQGRQNMTKELLSLYEKYHGAADKIINKIYPKL